MTISRPGSPADIGAESAAGAVASGGGADSGGSPAGAGAGGWTRQHPVTAATAVLLIVLLLVLIGLYLQSGTRIELWSNPEERLRWLLALLPGAIIVMQAYHLWFSRRVQYQLALTGSTENSSEHAGKERSKALVELYFSGRAIAVRYLLPAALVTVLCYFVAAALSSPGVYLRWLFVTGAEGAVQVAPHSWPQSEWAKAVMNGAAWGFAGAYTYLILLLSERYFRRDVTTGIAMWATAMPVLGAVMGGAAALLLAGGMPAVPAGAATGSDLSFTRNAFLFVVGMLPRQFSTFVQSGVRKFFQTGSTATAVRSQPLTLLRGIGPAVESRLEEEGIHDVAALAYASPHQLYRATTYSPRQIVDWIDEALLISTLPGHWEALERAGVTGAMDLAWYSNKPSSLQALADEVRMDKKVLGAVSARLYLDAQVRELWSIYWEKAAPAPEIGQAEPAATDQKPAEEPPLPPDTVTLQRNFAGGIAQDAQERFVVDLGRVDGVRRVRAPKDNQLTVMIDPARKDAIEAELDKRPELEPRVKRAPDDAQAAAADGKTPAEVTCADLSPRRVPQTHNNN